MFRSWPRVISLRFRFGISKTFQLQSSGYPEKKKEKQTEKPKRRKDHPIKICCIFYLKECLGLDLERYLFVSDLKYLKRFSFDRPVIL